MPPGFDLADLGQGQADRTDLFQRAVVGGFCHAFFLDDPVIPVRD
jgi:hypothetical protein